MTHPKGSERVLTKRQAKQIACLQTGRWLFQTDTLGIADNFSYQNEVLIFEAQRELALELMRRGKNAPNKDNPHAD